MPWVKQRRVNSSRRRDRRYCRSRLNIKLGPIECLEPRLTLSATSLDGKAFVDVGPSDNVAWDQPRITMQLLTEDFPDGTDPPSNIIVGPNTFNNWLLDTGANTTLGFQTAVTDMSQFDPKYQTDGKFNELGVGGVEEFDVSLAYRFDFSGSTNFERNTLLDKRIISNPDKDISIFGPWGIVGMPAMTERVTTLDFTPWTDVTGFNLFMNTDFYEEVPEPVGPRFTLEVDNRVSFDPEGSVVSGPGIPMWADLPFMTGQLKNNESRSEGNFLFDTGAQISIISSAMAFELGLDTNNDGVLNALDSNFARSETIGGIAGTTEVPVFLIDEVHIPSKQGPDMVWTDLQWVILDIVEGIDGVFGFDNMTSGWIEAFAINGQSGYTLKSHLDFRGWDTTGKGEIHFDFNEEYFTLIDPNGPGAIITESGGSTSVTENSVANDTYEIRLSQAPAADVTVTFVGGNGQVAAFDAANPGNDFVVFTPNNWDVPQTVVVHGVDDSVLEGFQRGFLRNISSSTDAAYDGVGMPRLSIGIIDDDFAGMMIIPTDGETRVTEGGDSDFYDVVLMTPPTQDVFILVQHVANQIQVAADATGGSLLIFTPANWDVPQRVRVTAIDDQVEEPLLPAYISHTVASTDENYAQAFGLAERAFVRDNDSSDNIGPRVTDVILGSSAWTTEFIDAVDGGGAGQGNGLGFSMTGASQLDNVPWVDLNKIYIQFDEDVSTDFIRSNLGIAGVNVPDYMDQVAISYGVDGTNVGTLTLNSPVANDILLVSLTDSLRDAGGNPLDGEWTDAVSLLSGNGSNGGSFNFRVDMLPGDVNDSDGVNYTDVFQALAQFGELTTPELSRFDVTGNGAINYTDVFAALNQFGDILPELPGGNSVWNPGGDIVPGDSDPGDGQKTDSGVAAAFVVDGFGGVRQVIATDQALPTNVDRLNPFLRRAIQHAQTIAANHEELDNDQLPQSPAGSLLPTWNLSLRPEPSLQSVPLQPFVMGEMGILARIHDLVLSELDYTRITDATMLHLEFEQPDGEMLRSSSPYLTERADPTEDLARVPLLGDLLDENESGPQVLLRPSGLVQPLNPDSF